jgi:hypothetical protein
MFLPVQQYRWYEAVYQWVCWLRPCPIACRPPWWGMFVYRDSTSKQEIRIPTDIVHCLKGVNHVHRITYICREKVVVFNCPWISFTLLFSFNNPTAPPVISIMHYHLSNAWLCSLGRLFETLYSRFLFRIGDVFSTSLFLGRDFCIWADKRWICLRRVFRSLGNVILYCVTHSLNTRLTHTWHIHIYGADDLPKSQCTKSLLKLL